MEFEDVLAKVGGYGKYQKHLLITFFIPFIAILPIWYFLDLFFLSVPEHWCHIPELDSLNFTMKQKQELRNLGVITSCSFTKVNYSNLLSADDAGILPENASIHRCKEGWHYDQTNYEFTAATQWNMVCDNSHYPSLVLSMGSVGSIIGTPIYGYLSDRFGRRSIFFILICLACTMTTCSLLATNFAIFIILRTINRSFVPSLFQLPLILCLEIVRPDMRARVNGVASISWIVGMGILPLLAYFTRNWIVLGICASIFLAFFLLYWTIVPESPRWLLIKERFDEAAEVMVKIAKKNGEHVNVTEISSVLRKVGNDVKNEYLRNKQTSPVTLLKYPQLRKRFLIITYFWVSTSFVYHGLQINGYNLSGNEFLNFFLLGVAELPGSCMGWLLIGKIGRRWSAVMSLILTGLGCLMPVVYRNDTVSIVASIIGKLSTSMAYIVLFQQSSELYPTTVRAIGTGLSATIAIIIGVGMPYIVYLHKYGEFIPFLVMAFLALTAAFSVSFLPETLDAILPQTVLDSESLGPDQKFFSYNRRPRQRQNEWPLTAEVLPSSTEYFSSEKDNEC